MAGEGEELMRGGERREHLHRAPRASWTTNSSRLEFSNAPPFAGEKPTRAREPAVLSTASGKIGALQREQAEYFA